MRSIGDNTLPAHWPLGCLFQFLPVLTTLYISASVHLHHVLLGLPLFLIPCGFQVRACQVMLLAGWLPEGEASPTLLCSTDKCGHLFLVCCPPEVLIAYLLWPQDTEDFAQTAVDKSLELMECSLSHSSCF